MPAIEEPNLTPRPASFETLRSAPVSDFDAQQYHQYFQYCRQNPQNVSEIIRKLKEGLRAAEVEAQVDEQYKYFIPRCQQAGILSFTVILEYIIMKNLSYNAQKSIEMAKGIAENSRSLFATLVCKERSEDICSLVKEGVSDGDLPLQRKFSGPMFQFQKQDGETISAMQHWDLGVLKRFGKAQYRFIAPVFTLGQQVAYGDNIILPFIRHDGNMVVESTLGGYSRVFQKLIHPSHHELWDRGTPQGHAKLVAIKQLNSPDPADFEHEYEILTRLGSRNSSNPYQAHLVKLLGTYKHRGQNHFVFHWATSNLRSFWDGTPHPNFADSIFWTLRQMTGIAGALKLIHHFRPTLPLDVKGNTTQRNALLSVIKEEKYWGRHGDIKPENFLYFSQSPDTEDPNGIVQISDFGLGRFHGRDSRSAISPSKAQATPTYEPPECQIQRAVSRKYDIWSLGCVYLEFLTWILIGSEEVYNFSESRGQKNLLDIDDDKYFEIFLTEDGTKDARVKTSVLAWVEKLRTSKQCSMLIHRLLNIIMHNMLVVEQNDRITSEALYERLNGLVDHCQDVKFMLDPVESAISVPPRIQSPPRGSATWPRGHQFHVTAAH